MANRLEMPELKQDIRYTTKKTLDTLLANRPQMPELKKEKKKKEKMCCLHVSVLTNQDITKCGKRQSIPNKEDREIGPPLMAVLKTNKNKQTNKQTNTHREKMCCLH